METLITTDQDPSFRETLANIKKTMESLVGHYDQRDQIGRAWNDVEDGY